MEGFLVVAAACNNTSYKGIDRVPTYPAQYPDEAVGSEANAFGGYLSDDTNLIMSLEKAVELLRMFSSSRRKFEIIWCSNEEGISAASEDCGWTNYGYDVACVNGDYWSIVDDFSSLSWAKQYRSRLNKFGLFDDKTSAEEYMNGYRLNDEPDNDAPFEVMRVMGVEVDA